MSLKSQIKIKVEVIFPESMQTSGGINKVIMSVDEDQANKLNVDCSKDRIKIDNVIGQLIIERSLKNNEPEDPPSADEDDRYSDD